MKPTYPLPEPKSVWTHFFDLVCVPRPSKAEAPAIEFLQRWAQQRGLDARPDSAGNLAVHVPATRDSSTAEPVILQCHVDIVAVTASGDNGGADATRGLIPTVRGDLDASNSKRLKPNEAGDWIIAPYSTLGADNGIGVAMMMALAELSDRPVPLQLLFTVDEEAGMSGAGGLDPKALGLSAHQLINIDTEDDDEITIGAAGGRDATFTWNGQWESTAGMACWSIAIDGLKGGHSGVEINQGRANANRLMARLLSQLSQRYGARIVSLKGGSRRNAIPDTCTAVVAIDGAQQEAAKTSIEEWSGQVNELYAGRDNAVQWQFAAAAAAQQCLTPSSTAGLLSLLAAIPTGICEMTPEIPVLVESSCNMAIVELNVATACQIICSTRGTTRAALDDIAESLRGVARLAGARLEFAEGYPGWKPSLGSHLLQVAIDQYQRLFGDKPKVHAIHAGLECGLLMEKMPGLNAISIGPTIKGNHAVGERVQISSVAKSYQYLQAILHAL